MPPFTNTLIGRLLFKDASPSAAKARTTEDGDRIVEFTPPLVEYLRLYGSWASYGAVYKTQPAVRAVIDFLARNIAELVCTVYEHVPETSEQIKLPDHPLSRLLRHPSGANSMVGMSRYRFMFATVSDLAIYDRAYWWKVRDRSTVTALVRIPVSQLWPEYDARTNVLLHYRTSSGAVIQPEDLVVFNGYHPESNAAGIAPLETLRRILAEDWAASVNREFFWKNAARIEGVIERPLDAPDWSETARTRFRADWEEIMTGAHNAGRTAILEEGMQLKDHSFSPRDSQYLEGRKLVREEVARQYGVAPTLVGILDHATFSNVESQHTHAYQDVFGPWLRRLTDDVDMQLLPEFNPFDRSDRQFTSFNLDTKLRGSFLEEAEVITTAVGGPWMLREEARIRKGLPVDEASMRALIVPLNTQLGGGPQASPNSPTEVPKALPPQAKSVDLTRMDEVRQEFSEATARAVRRQFERQRQVVKSRAGASSRPLFQTDRWNRELAEELFSLSFTAGKSAGELTAQSAKAEFDAERTRNYWLSDAAFSAEQINLATKAALAANDDIDAVFDARIAEAEQIGTSRTTRAVNWSVLETARQIGG